MIFMTIENEIKEAMFRFCLKQCAVDGILPIDEVDNVVETAFEVVSDEVGGEINITKFYRYHLYAGEEFTSEILPENVKENGVICERGIHLGTFLADTYADNDDVGKVIMRGYDVIYDLDKQKIILLYRVLISDNELLTIYRVETDYIEDFNLYEFMVDLAAQICTKVRLPKIKTKEAA